MSRSSPADPDAVGARLDEEAPGYLDRARRSAEELGAHSETSATRAALVDVEELSEIDTDAPVASSSKVGSLLKSLIKRLLAWYLGHLAAQTKSLGLAVVRFGDELSRRTDELEGRQSTTEAELRELTERVERLERKP